MHLALNTVHVNAQYLIGVLLLLHLAALVHGHTIVFQDLLLQYILYLILQFHDAVPEAFAAVHSHGVLLFVRNVK